VAKLGIHEIRRRALELLADEPKGIRRSVLVQAIASESPDTPINTIQVQVGEITRVFADRVYQPSRGVYALRNAPEGKTDTRSGPPAEIAGLTEVGFEHIGHWYIDGGSLGVHISRLGHRAQALYAFTIHDQVVFIRKSVESLAKHLNAYTRSNSGQSVAGKVRALILNALREGQAVEIWAFVDGDPCYYRGIRVSVPAGIEDTLISRVRPTWNRQIGAP